MAIRLQQFWFALGGSLCLFGCLPREKPISVDYKTYKDAAAADVIAKGWIPEFIPHSAHEIRLECLLDTDEVWLVFRFDPADLARMTEGLKPIAVDQLGDDYQSVGPSWWPRSFVPFLIYVHRVPETGYLAVDKENMKAYYWRPIRKPQE